MTAPEPDEIPHGPEDDYDPEEEFEFDTTPEELAARLTSGSPKGEDSLRDLARHLRHPPKRRRR